MDQRKKNKTGKKSRDDSLIPLSVIIPDCADNKNLSLIIESVKKINDPFRKEFEVIIPSSTVKLTAGSITGNELIRHLIEKEKIRVTEVPEDLTLAERIREGARQATKKNLVILESGGLKKAFPFNLFTLISQEDLNANRILIPGFTEDTKKRKNIHWPVLIMSTELARYLFSDLMSPAQDYQVELFAKAGKLGFTGKEIPFAHHSPFSGYQKRTAGMVAKQVWRLRFFAYWYILLPVKEIRSKPHLTYSFLSGPAYLRGIFVSIAAILFFILPILSYNSGISGDEQKFHYLYGKNVFNYFATLGQDTTALHYTDSELHLYGPAFDLVTVIVNELFHVENEYGVRHMLNGFSGWLAMLFAGLLATMVAGWRAGIITLVLMFLSPRFLGHSFNNPKDIPFAMAVIFALFYMIRFLKAFPRPSVSTVLLTALGIGLAIGVRVGGLLLIAYLVFFSGIYFLATSQRGSLLTESNMKRLGRLFGLIVIISVTGYLIGIATWPYALQAPFSNPFKALDIMTHYTTSIRQLFEGRIIWSNKAPWYYVLKYMAITIPIVVLAGVALFFALIHKMRKGNYLWLFIIAFTFIFPVIYIINKESNVYGGWRHSMFVYPPMVIAASIGFVTGYNLLKSRILRYVSITLFTGLCLLPFRHIVANHPFEYIYYNELTGGTNRALGKYEMDYFFHSLRAGSEWLLENKIKPRLNESSEPVLVASNLNIAYYFRQYSNKVNTVYTRFYERSRDNWDYGIFVNTYINPYQLRTGLWPPANTIHSIDVDKVPICAIIERNNKLAYEGSKLISEQKYDEGISLLEQSIALEPFDEEALLNLARAYNQTKQYHKTGDVLNRCLKIYPDYDKALNLLGIMYMDQEKYDEAMDTFLKTMQVNERFVSAYYNMGLVYLMQNNVDLAINWFIKAIEVNEYHKSSYMALAEIYYQLGMQDEARYYYDIGSKLK